MRTEPDEYRCPSCGAWLQWIEVSTDFVTAHHSCPECGAPIPSPDELPRRPPLADRIAQYRDQLEQTGDATPPWVVDITDGEWHELEVSWWDDGDGEVRVDGVTLHRGPVDGAEDD